MAKWPSFETKDLDLDSDEASPKCSGVGKTTIGR
jgi:hypothetical protein